MSFILPFSMFTNDLMSPPLDLWMPGFVFNISIAVAPFDSQVLNML
jgi:hypothetical protein